MDNKLTNVHICYSCVCCNGSNCKYYMIERNPGMNELKTMIPSMFQLTNNIKYLPLTASKHRRYLQHGIGNQCRGNS